MQFFYRAITTSIASLLWLVVVLTGNAVAQDTGSYGGTSAESTTSEKKNPYKELTLREVYELVRTKNPSVQSAKSRVKAAKGRVTQASLRPNPFFKGEAENFGGSGRFQDSRSLEKKFVLRYMIETWDKRDLRTKVAKANVDLFKRRYEATKLDALAEASQAFYGVLAAKRRVELRKELNQLAKKGFKTVSQQVESGKVSSLEKTKAQVEKSKTQIALNRARRELDAAKQELASSWGKGEPENFSAKGILPLPDKLHPLSEYQKKLTDNPVYELARQKIDQREQSVQLANARSVPNVTFGGGYKSHNFTDDHSFIVNMTLPIPLFDTNQGNIKSAKNELQSAKNNLDSIETKLMTRLKSHYENLQATHQALTGLKNDVIPGAKRAYEASLKGFKAGKFDYLDVLDAQRTLFENRIQYVRSLKEFHRTQAEVKRLTAELAQDNTNTKKE
ncbi:MAG: TolC family protein [bacterium]